MPNETLHTNLVWRERMTFDASPQSGDAEADADVDAKHGHECACGPRAIFKKCRLTVAVAATPADERLQRAVCIMDS